MNVTSIHIHSCGVGEVFTIRLQDHGIYFPLLKVCECVCYYVKHCVLNWLKLCI
jgi:hypothetical protein